MLLKKLLSSILMSGLVVSMVACGGGGNTPAQDNPATKPTEKVEEKVKEEVKEEPKTKAIGIVTEDYKPFNYLDKNGVLVGSSTEKVKKALEKMDDKTEIEVLPWAKAYDLALTEENVFIFSMGRSKEREDKFKWVKPISAINNYLFKLKKNKDIKIEKLEDAKKYKIATMSEDFTEQSLKTNGFDKQLVSSPKQSQSTRQLFEGATDLWIGTAEGDVLKELVEAEGYKVDDIEVALKIDDFKVDLWLGANIKTSDEIVNKFVKAME